MKYMHKNKLVPPTSTYGQGNHAPTVEEATDVFMAWRRSNYMYILRGDICLGFTQSMVSFKTAYAEAQNDTGAISWEDQKSYEVRGD